MAWVWTGTVILSVLYGFAAGNGAAIGAAAMEGAGAALELCLAMGGALCLWSGVMEVMSRSGLSGKLSRLLAPLLKRLFPRGSEDRETMDALAQNLSANLLGLGNAATPAGLQAAKGLCRLTGSTAAGKELCRLVVMNTASLQLLPTTVAALRASAGAANAFDILPAVWVSSLVSVTVGLLCERLLGRAFP